MNSPTEIITLPTKEYTGIVSHSTGIDNLIHTKESAENAVLNIGGEHQNVYAVVEEDVEPCLEGDWCIDFDEFSDRPILNRAYPKDICPAHVKQHKIIGSNDPKLYDNRENNTPFRRLTSNPKKLQQSFLKEFVKNPDGEYVVDYESKHEYGKYLHGKPGYVYVTKLKLNQDNEANITLVEEKMYSLKQLRQAILDYGYTVTGEGDIEKNLDNWIKENLKQ
ncbi:MAG: hypothetical protein ACJAVA_000243 [Flavobacteriaceae bacterium]|jgi:hypothetical protein